MITGWLVKVVLGIAVVGFFAVELGSPLVMRAQLDGVAHDAADEAGFELRTRGEADAEVAAKEIAEKNGATIEEFRIEDGRVHLKVHKQAKSFLLKRFDQTESWYDVRVSATSEKGN